MKKNNHSFIRLYEQLLETTVQGEHKIFYDLYPSGVSLYYMEFSPSQNSEFPDAVESVEKETTTYQPRILISDNYSSFIELEDIYIKVSESDVTIKDYTGLKYEEVKKELEDLGLIVMEKYLDGPLTKYELQSYYDLGYRWEDKNIIYQSITPGTVVSTKTVIKFGIFSMGDY